MMNSNLVLSNNEIQSREIEEKLKKRILNYVYPDLMRIENELKKQMFGSVLLTNTISKYIINSGGKRLRPLLMILSARLCGYNGKKDVTLALAFEFLHVATLLHDDVIDGAELRRNRPAANKLWGNQAVVLVGDFLYSKALMIAIEYDNMQIMEALAKAANLMAEGEILQLINTGKIDITEKDYFEIISLKTAALMSAACKVGAILGGAKEELVENLSYYGYHLGLAFQLVDDLLDYKGTTEELGKRVGKDFGEGKVTLPLIFALKNAKEEEREFLIDAFENREKNPSMFEKVKSLVQKLGGVEYTQKVAREHIKKAQETLKVFPDSELKNIFIDISDYVLYRRF